MPLPVGPILTRDLYLQENLGIGAHPRLLASLYPVENLGIWAHPTLLGDLYVVENLGIWAHPRLVGTLFPHEATTDGKAPAWLLKLVPDEQFAGGQVDIYGDGLGEWEEIAATSTPTADSQSGANAPAYAINRLGTSWISTGGTAAWLRLTFASAQPVIAIALEADNSNWGVPQFRFSDGGANVNGVVPVGVYVAGGPLLPVGDGRTVYVLPAPRTSTYVEVRIQSGGTSTRSLREVWVWADLDQVAENSVPKLGVDVMGIVTWSNRSGGLWPANDPSPTLTPAATVTVPEAGHSGNVTVERDCD